MSGSCVLPSAIAQEYDAGCVESENDDEPRELADDFLQRLLSALSRLPDLTVLSSLRDDSDDDDVFTATATTDDGAESCSLPDAIWRILSGRTTTLPMMRDLTDIAEAEEESRHQWETGLVLASRLVKSSSALEIHSTAVSSCIVSVGGDVGDDNCYIMFRMTCMLLCCTALYQCPQPLPARWKRWQSMQLETLQLYQRHILLPLHPRYSVPTWCSHVLPSTAHLHNALRLTNAPSVTDSRWMAWEAGAVHCSAHLAIIICPVGQNPCASTLQLLFALLNKHVLRGRYELLYGHPWRLRKDLQHCGGGPADNDRTKSVTLAHLTIDSAQDDKEDRNETVLGVKTVWPDTGIALLVAASWTLRPSHWTVRYQWSMFFPHVNALLLEGEASSVENEENIYDGEQGGKENNRRIIASYGYGLLNQLIQQTVPRSLSVGTNNGAPDSPIGTCQLIANQIIAASLFDRQNFHFEQVGMTNKERFPVQQSLPDAVGAFQLLKLLVAKYSPMYQIEIVRKLLQDCPHPGLRPKLVDLLRGFISWNDEDAEYQVWMFLDRNFVSELEVRVIDGSDSTVVCDLIDDVEVHLAALSLLQLWILFKGSAPAALTNLETRLRRMYISIHNAEIKWSQPPSVNTDVSHAQAVPSWLPLNRHRLNLLECSLRQIVDLLTTLTEN